MPILYGDRIIGRIEPVYDRKNRKLNILNIWYESNTKLTKGMGNSINHGWSVMDLPTKFIIVEGEK